MRSRFLLCFVVLASACAPIERTSMLEQPIGQTLTVGPGDLVAKITKQRDLENVLGRADIWGGKTDEGYSELRFGGLEPSGELVFYRRDVGILTNETTMSRYNVSHGYFRRNSSSGAVTMIGPPKDYHLVTPADAIAIRLPPGTKAFAFEGRTIEIASATPVSLAYSVR